MSAKIYQKNFSSLLVAFTEDNVIHDIKHNSRTSKLEYAKLKMNVTRNKMFDKSPIAIKDGLSDKDLVKSIIAKSKNHDHIKFESDAAAIVHCYKRSKHDVRKFVDRANFIIRDSKSKSKVWRCQEGASRIVEFIDANGRVEVIKQFGHFFLNTFIEYDQK